MDRRAFITLISGVLATPIAVKAQQVEKRIGVLAGPLWEARWAPFRERLRDLGYVEGQNIRIEWRSSDGRAERFPALATELVRLKVDVIVAGDNPAIASAQKATRTIPVVMVLSQDPVASGFARSLARPGGNLTGLTVQGTDLQGKVLELLKEAVPSTARIGILWDSTEPGRHVQAKEAEVAARALGLHSRLVEVRGPDELDRVFAAMAREKLDAVRVQPSGMTSANRTRIAELALKNRLPSIGPAGWYAESGGLLAYGGKDSHQFDRAAYYVDKILKGAKPGDLPIEQPTLFELKINLKTAKQLGLTIPQTLLLRADQIIE